MRYLKAKDLRTLALLAFIVLFSAGVFSVGRAPEEGEAPDSCTSIQVGTELSTDGSVIHLPHLRRWSLPELVEYRSAQKLTPKAP